MTRNLQIFHLKSFQYPILLSNCFYLTLYILFAVDDMETSSRRNKKLVNFRLWTYWDFLMHDYITCISVRFWNFQWMKNTKKMVNDWRLGWIPRDFLSSRIHIPIFLALIGSNFFALSFERKFCFEKPHTTQNGWT